MGTGAEAGGGRRPDAGAPFTRPPAGGWPREEVIALAGLAFLLVVTVVWWAAALWPVSTGAPGWLQTARAVCFGAYHDGLPDLGGWILLIGEPIGMTVALLIMWRDATLSGLRRLAGGVPGRVLLAGAGAVLLLGLGGAGWRAGTAAAALPPDVLVASGTRRLSGPAPALALRDQHGEDLSLERFAGGPVLVTFTFANCETVCPLLVRDALTAQREVGEEQLGVVIVTVDPWRDTPERLPHIAERWGLGARAFLGGGSVAEVERALDEWGVARSRDPRTGEVAHAPIMFLVDARGRLTHSTAGPSAEVVRLARGALGDR